MTGTEHTGNVQQTQRLKSTLLNVTNCYNYLREQFGSICYDLKYVYVITQLFYRGTCNCLLNSVYETVVLKYTRLCSRTFLELNNGNSPAAYREAITKGTVMFLRKNTCISIYFSTCVCVCKDIKKARDFQKNIYFCFTDYTKAFDCVDHYEHS